MRKQITILSILLFTFLIIIPSNAVMATENEVSTSSPAKFNNEMIKSYAGHQFSLRKNIDYRGRLCNTPYYAPENNNDSGYFKKFIEFVDENLFGIIFLIFIFYLSFIYCWPWKLYRNYKTIKLYRRENNNNDKKFTTKRCEEDGDEKGRNNVYLINEDDKTYQLLADYNTLKKLGYGSASRKDKLFSKNDYEIKSRIKINNIFSYIGNIIKFKNDT